MSDAPARPPEPQVGTPRPPATLTLEVGAVTHRGLVRTNNEDAFLLSGLVSQAMAGSGPGAITVKSSLAPAGLVVAVADGVGGNASGEVASRLTLETLAGSWAGWPPASSAAASGDAMSHWRRALERAHAVVTAQAAAAPGEPGMASTVAGAHLHPGWGAVVFHAGDSRVCRFRQGILKALTVDHSFAELGREGAHYGSEAPRTSSAVYKCVGCRAKELDPAVTNAVPALNPGDRYLLATDGLHDMVGAERIEELLGAHPGTAAALEALLEAALAAGGVDNVTMILADVRSAAPAGTGDLETMEAGADGQ